MRVLAAVLPSLALLSTGCLEQTQLPGDVPDPGVAVIDDGPGEGEGEAPAEGEGEIPAEGEGEGEGEFPPIVVRLSELDCHGNDRLELLATPGARLDPIAVHVDDHQPVPLTGLVVPPDGRLVVEQAELEGPPLDVPCFDGSVRLVRGEEVLDEVRMPSFPGSFLGTSLCRVPEGSPTFSLCTPTLGGENTPFLDPEPILFDPLVPALIDFEIAPADVAALRSAPRDYVAAEMTVTQGGETFGPVVVGVALKGNVSGSFRTLDGKAAFKVKFHEIVPGQRFLGLRGIKLNNMVEDASLTHEFVAYPLLRAAGVPAARAGASIVRVNGASYGLHATIERIDRTWASRHFPTTTHIYEAGILGLDLTPGREPEFEVEAGDEDDASDLTSLTAVSELVGDPFLSALSARTRLGPTARSWMASQFIAHWDGYAGGTNNYYLHSDAAGAFTFIPSGLDQSLETTPYPLKTGRSIYAGQGVLFARCRATAACNAILDQETAAMMSQLERFDAAGFFDDVVAAIGPAILSDPRLEWSMEEIQAAQEATRAFLVGRPSVLAQ
jgi:hypothetical protein